MLVAVGFLASVGVAIYLLYAMMVWHAWQQQSQGTSLWLQKVSGGLPWPLTLLFEALAAYILTLENWVEGWFREQTYSGTKHFDTQADTVANNMRSLHLSGRNVMQQMTVTLSEVANQTHAFTSGAWKDYVDTTEQALHSDITNELNADVSQLDNRITQVHDIDTQYTYNATVQLYNQAQQDRTKEQHDVDTTNTRIDDTVTTLRSDIVAAHDHAVSASAAFTDRAIDSVNTRISDVHNELASSIAEDVHALTGSITDVRNYAQDGIKTIDAYIAGTVAVALEAEKTWRNDCGDPLCNNLLDYAKEFGKLSGFLATGAMLAAFAEMVANPKAAAETTNSIVSAVASPIENAARSLIGV